MADFYSLEEASRVLGMSPEELKTKAQHREVRAFLDGGSWRFRVADVDELARRRGLGSDPELAMSDLDLSIPSSSASGIDFSKFQLGLDDDLDGPAKPAGAGQDEGSDSDHELLLDDLKVPQNPGANSSSVIIGMAPEGKRPSDSDVRLVPDNAKGASDSDVRVSPAPSRGASDSDVRRSPVTPKGASDSDVTLFAEETSEHGFSGSDSGSGDTGIRPNPFAESSAEVPAGEAHDSDFELTPSNVIDALQPDSGSDFELTALDPSDEFESTPLLGPGDSDVTAAEPGASGINLGRPSDSGINLLGSASGFDMGGESSIELSPLSASEIQPKPSARRTPPAEKPATPPRGKAEKDIFDDTDFEVDALGGEDRTVQLGPASDFELEEAESGSEVFAIDEDDVDQNAATAMSPGILEDDDEGFDDSTPSGEMSSSAWDVESESSSAPERSGASPILAPSAATAEWGGLWVGLLGVTTVFMLLLTFISMDLVRNLHGYQGGTPASGIVKSIAGLMGMGG